MNGGLSLSGSSGTVRAYGLTKIRSNGIRIHHSIADLMLLRLTGNQAVPKVVFPQ